MRQAAGPLVVRCPPTDSHFHCRRVIRRGLFGNVKALLTAADWFARYTQEPQRTLSIIGSKPAFVA